MNKVTVDSGKRAPPAPRAARCSPISTPRRKRTGLATTTGVNSDTGLIALTLGGGIGRLGRKHGLSCDNMLSAEIVTANGRGAHASRRGRIPNCFGALCGGGGNFGVVTAITYRLHPLGPTVSCRTGWPNDCEAARATPCGSTPNFLRGAPDEVFVWTRRW